MNCVSIVNQLLETWDLGSLTVDEEIGTASSLKEYTHGWENDGKNDLADIAIVKCQSLLPYGCSY